MDAEKIVAFIRSNLPVAALVAFITAGIAWSAIHALYEERVKALTSRVTDLEGKVTGLQEEVGVLKEAAERKLEPSSATFTAAELQEASATETVVP